MLRAIFLILTASVWALSSLSTGEARRRACRMIAHHIRRLEHGLRCLLLLMRARPATPKPAPFEVRPGTRPSRQKAARRRPARFSLSLTALAAGFAANGAKVAFPRPRPGPRTPPAPRLPDDPTAPAPIADPAVMLHARLEAMRAVFADPQGHAARFAAILKGAGVRLKALKALIPDPGLWQITDHVCAVSAALPARPLLDTS